VRDPFARLPKRNQDEANDGTASLQFTATEPSAPPTDSSHTVSDPAFATKETRIDPASPSDPVGSSSRGMPLPRKGEIAYVAKWGIVNCAAALSWRVSEEGRYRLALEVRDSASASPANNYTQTSEGQVTSRGLTPRFFATESAKGKSTATFDWALGELKLAGANWSETLPLPKDAQDPLSALLQLSFQPPRDVVSAPVTDGTTTETYSWQVQGEESLTLDSGSFKTLHISKQRAPDEAGVEIWLSLEHHYLPVKIVYINREGSADLQLSMSSIELSPGH
jgi:hypothetical protein